MPVRHEHDDHHSPAPAHANPQVRAACRAPIRRPGRGAREAPVGRVASPRTADGPRHGECSTSGGPEPADDQPTAPRVAAGGPRAVRGALPQGLPRHRDARRRQDHLRPDAGRAAAVPREVARVVVVCPTDHLRLQWADAADAMGIVLDPGLTNAGRPGARRHPGLRDHLRAGRRQADAARGPRRPRQDAGDPRRGAPRRRRPLLGRGGRGGVRPRRAPALPDRHAVPHQARRAHPLRPLRGGHLRGRRRRVGLVSRADYTYGYKEALADYVVRPVVFAAYTGTSRWRNSAGEVVAASLSEAGTRSVEMQAWRTALDPKGQWVPHVIAAMDDRITHLRETGMPDAAGLILASDQDDARAYAKIVRRVTGKAPELILSDDPKASKKIERFATGVGPHRRLRPDDLRGRRRPAGRRPGVDDLLPDAAVLRPGRGPRRPRPRRRTSRRPSSSPRCARCCRWPPPWRSSATTSCRRRRPRPATSWTWSRCRPRSSARTGAAVGGPGGRRPLRATCCTAGRRTPARARADPVVAPEDEEFLGIPGLLTPAQTAELLSKRDDELRVRIAASHRDDPDDFMVVEDHPDEDDAGPLVARRRRAAPRDQPAGQPGRGPHRAAARGGAHAAARSRCPARRRRRRPSTSSAPAGSVSARCCDGLQPPPPSGDMACGGGSRVRPGARGGPRRPPPARVRLQPPAEGVRHEARNRRSSCSRSARS